MGFPRGLCVLMDDRAFLTWLIGRGLPVAVGMAVARAWSGAAARSVEQELMADPACAKPAFVRGWDSLAVQQHFG